MAEQRIRAIALALIRRGPAILVFDDDADRENGPFCRPPGGGIEWGETSAAAVRREVEEEVGSGLSASRLLGVLENRFTYCGDFRHEVVFVYEVALARAELYELDIIQGDEGGTPMPLRWHDLADTSVRLVPEGLRELIASPPDMMRA